MKKKFGTLRNCPLWASVRLSRVSVRTGFPVCGNHSQFTCNSAYASVSDRAPLVGRHGNAGFDPDLVPDFDGLWRPGSVTKVTEYLHVDVPDPVRPSFTLPVGLDVQIMETIPVQL